MQIKKVDWEIEEEAKRYLGNDNVYYVLQGRLGNQLFGLSEAFRIHKKLSKKIVIDISDIILNGFSIPTWTTNAEYDWAEIVHNPNYSIFKNNVELINLGFCKLEEYLDFTFFQGFSVNYNDICESGLFQKGIFPFDVKTDRINSTYSVISFRYGDYFKNPHLGILPMKYYRNAFKRLKVMNINDPLYLFSDDLKKAQSELNNFETNLVYSQLPDSTDLENLYIMSMGYTHIIANSTFSFWAAFFSNGKCFYPDPFYIGDRDFHQNMFWPDAEPVEYTRIPNLRYFVNRLKYKIYKSKLFK